MDNPPLDVRWNFSGTKAHGEIVREYCGNPPEAFPNNILD
jgi:hypothetical protein